LVGTGVGAFVGAGVGAAVGVLVGLGVGCGAGSSVDLELPQPSGFHVDFSLQKLGPEPQ
jgi:hypothetical protein